MAGFNDPLQGGVAGTSTIDDDLDPSVLIESEDGKDYIEIDTTDDAEKLILAGGAADVHVKGTLTMLDEKKIQLFKAGEGVSDYPRLEFNAGSTTSIVSKTSTNHLYFGTNSTNRLNIDHLGKISTGSETASMSDHAGSIHIYTGNSGQTDISGNADNLIIEGNANTGLSIASPHTSQAQIAFTANGVNNDRGAITYIHHGVGGGELMTFRVNDAVRATIGPRGVITPNSGAIQYHQGTGADTATTQAVYLANTAGNANDTLVIDFQNGNVGDVTLTRAVDKVRFYNVPADGTAATVTARITQGSSNHTISYADADVACYSGVDSGAVTGEIKFSGGVHHTQSTGSGDVDIVSFTSIPTGSTFNIYAAVIGQDFS